MLVTGFTFSFVPQMVTARCIGTWLNFYQTTRRHITITAARTSKEIYVYWITDVPICSGMELHGDSYRLSSKLNVSGKELLRNRPTHLEHEKQSSHRKQTANANNWISNCVPSFCAGSAHVETRRR